MCLYQTGFTLREIRPTAHAQIRGGLMTSRLRESLLVEEWLPTLCSRYDTHPNWVKSVRRPPNDLLRAAAREVWRKPALTLSV